MTERSPRRIRKFPLLLPKGVTRQVALRKVRTSKKIRGSAGYVISVFVST
jgi:hypothetical protein